jgi:hypothetical protein
MKEARNIKHTTSSRKLEGDGRKTSSSGPLENVSTEIQRNLPYFWTATTTVGSGDCDRLTLEGIKCFRDCRFFFHRGRREFIIFPQVDPNFVSR